MTKSRNPATPHAALAATEADIYADRARAEDVLRDARAAETLARDACERLRAAAETATSEHQRSARDAEDREREWMADQTDARWSAVVAARAERDQNELRAKAAHAVAEGAAADLATATKRTGDARLAHMAAEDRVKDTVANRERDARRAVALDSIKALEGMVSDFGSIAARGVLGACYCPKGADPFLAPRPQELVRAALVLATEEAQLLVWTIGTSQAEKEGRRVGYKRVVLLMEHAANIARAIE